MGGLERDALILLGEPRVRPSLAESAQTAVGVDPAVDVERATGQNGQTEVTTKGCSRSHCTIVGLSM